MSLSVDEKQKIIADHQRKNKDTGSSEVQIALLTSDIKKLTEHFKTYVKDVHSRRGLTAKVSRRRKLLKYLKTTNAAGYRDLINKLKLRDIAS